MEPGMQPNMDSNQKRVRFTIKNRKYCDVPKDTTIIKLDKFHRNRMYDLHILEDDCREMDRKEELKVPESMKRERLEKLCASIRSYKDQEILDEKFRLQLRKGNQELLTLQSQLACAEAAVIMAEQKAAAERKRLDYKNAREFRTLEGKMERSRIQKEICRDEMMDELKKFEYRCGLQKQMEFNFEERKRECKQKLKDRMEMLALEERQKKEDEDEWCALQEKKMKYRRQIDECNAMQEDLKQEFAAKIAAEDAKTDNWMEEREREMRAKKEAKRQQLLRLQEWGGMVCARLENAEKEKRMKDEFMTDLLVEERLFLMDRKAEQREAFEEEQRRQAREELARYEAMRDMRKSDDNNQRRRDHAEMIGLLNKHHDDERKKAMKQKEIKRDTRTCLAADMQYRRDYKRDMAQRDMDRYNMEQAAQKRYLEAVEEERLRLLRIRPPKVLLYLPHGVIRESDKDHLELPSLEEKIKFT